MEKGSRFPYGSRGESVVLSLRTTPDGMLVVTHSLGPAFYISPETEVIA
jgi:hypothetical protein